MVSVSRPVLWGILTFLALGVLLQPRQLPAQDVGCRAVDLNDFPRKCTFLEEHGYCLVNALESYYQCALDADSFWENAVCQMGVQVDLLACNISLPLTLIQTIMRI